MNLDVASPASRTTILYLHDLDDHIIAETETSGNTLREYVWMGDTPLAVVDNVPTSPTIFYVHTDHLMRPLRMTDASAALAWSVAYEPFGAVASVNAVSSAIDLRFPGQWFQLENGLHYNWHRHYDATLGRYLQPDPNGNEFVSSAIGSDINFDPAQTTPASTLTPFLLEYTPAIRNGLPQPSLRVQPYSYARSTPLSAIDPSGLQAQVVIGRCLRFPQLCAAPIAAAVAAGVNACLRTMAGSSGGGGGGDDYQRCMRAANGNENDWASFCRTIRRGIPNNVVGEGTARAACFNHTLESTQNKINWCENQFGRH